MHFTHHQLRGLVCLPLGVALLDQRGSSVPGNRIRRAFRAFPQPRPIVKIPPVVVDQYDRLARLCVGGPVIALAQREIGYRYSLVDRAPLLSLVSLDRNRINGLPPWKIVAKGELEQWDRF